MSILRRPGRSLDQGGDLLGQLVHACLVEDRPARGHVGPQALEQVRRLHAAGKGVIGMKVLGEGSIAKEGRMDQSIAWVLKNNAADVLDIGFLEIAEIDDIARRIAAV